MASVTAMAEAGDKIRINRAPVLTLWAAVVAERLGIDRDAALTLGRAVAGTSAQMKGHLASKFGSDLARVRVAMERRAASLSPEGLNRRGFALYEAFRPAVPAGAQGWGTAG